MATLPEGPIDWPTLAEICGDRQERMMALLALFLDDARAELARLEEARSGGDLPEVGEIAHRVRGAAQLMGVGSMTALAGALEKAGKRSASDEAYRLTTELTAAFVGVEQFLAPLLAKPA